MGRQLGSYRILSLIGAGGMGVVFLAEDTRLHRKVAIKRVLPGGMHPQAHRRLRNEAQAAARIEHPNICAIYEIEEDSRGPYIVMPFVYGETLAARLASGPLPVADSIAVASKWPIRHARSRR